MPKKLILIAAPSKVAEGFMFLSNTIVTRKTAIGDPKAQLNY